MNIHIFGFPHIHFSEGTYNDPFSFLVRNFSKWMKQRGHKIYFYGTEESNIDCTEHINVLRADEYDKHFSENRNQNYIYNRHKDDSIWSTFNARCRHEFQSRLSPGDVVSTLCGIQSEIPCGCYRNPKVDLFVCHPYINSTHNVFLSHTWRAYTYGMLKSEYSKDGEHIGAFHNDTMIYPGLDWNDYKFVKDKKDYILYIGRINQLKGIYSLISVCVQNGMNLKIGGSLYRGVEHELFDIIDNHSNIEYLGGLNHKDKVEYLSNAKCLVSPSFYHEPFGLINIEAFACGTPVISSSWGAPSEYINHGINGFQCSDTEDLKYFLNKLNTINYDWCLESVDTGFFNKDRMISAYESYLNRLVSVYEYKYNPTKKITPDRWFS